MGVRKYGEIDHFDFGIEDHGSLTWNGNDVDEFESAINATTRRQSTERGGCLTKTSCTHTREPKLTRVPQSEFAMGEGT